MCLISVIKHKTKITNIPQEILGFSLNGEYVDSSTNIILLFHIQYFFKKEKKVLSSYMMFLKLKDKKKSIIIVANKITFLKKYF